jgi:hypothetical protein
MPPACRAERTPRAAVVTAHRCCRAAPGFHGNPTRTCWKASRRRGVRARSCRGLACSSLRPSRAGGRFPWKPEMDVWEGTRRRRESEPALAAASRASRSGARFQWKPETDVVEGARQGSMETRDRRARRGAVATGIKPHLHASRAGLSASRAGGRFPWKPEMDVWEGTRRRRESEPALAAASRARLRATRAYPSHCGSWRLEDVRASFDRALPADFMRRSPCRMLRDSAQGFHGNMGWRRCKGIAPNSTPRLELVSQGFARAAEHGARMLPDAAPGFPRGR